MALTKSEAVSELGDPQALQNSACENAQETASRTFLVFRGPFDFGNPAVFGTFETAWSEQLRILLLRRGNRHKRKKVLAQLKDG